MCWFSGRRPQARKSVVARVRPLDCDDASAAAGTGFVCSTCGRSDLPEAGSWDPPICQECDAAINFDAEMESGAYDNL